MADIMNRDCDNVSCGDCVSLEEVDCSTERGRSSLSEFWNGVYIERLSEDGDFAEMDDLLSSTKRLPPLDALEADEDESSVRHLASRIVWDGGRTEDDEGSPLPSEAVVDVPSSCRDVEFYLADWLGNTYGVSTSGFDYRSQREKE